MNTVVFGIVRIKVIQLFFRAGLVHAILLSYLKNWSLCSSFSKIRMYLLLPVKSSLLYLIMYHLTSELSFLVFTDLQTSCKLLRINLRS